jgi:hypothetical protein
LVNSEADTQPTVVNYSMGGTATAGVNYSTANVTGQITIPAGSRGVMLPVSTLPIPGGNKTAVVTVVPGDGYTPGRMSAVVKILGR